MAYNDKWHTKLIINVEVQAADEQAAQRKWERVLEKLKYQVGYLKFEPQLEPNWLPVVEEETIDHDH